MSERRIGRFRISDKYFMDLDLDAEHYIFRGMVIVEAKHDWMRKCFEYTAYSRFFESVDEGAIAPLYKPVFHLDDNDPIRWELVGYD